LLYVRRDGGEDVGASKEVGLGREARQQARWRELSNHAMAYSRWS
jgi:hypothetical protein